MKKLNHRHVSVPGISTQLITPFEDPKTSGFQDPEGFFIKVDGVEGMLLVVPFGQDTAELTKFTNSGDGWNLLKCKEIIADERNTATGIKVGI